MKETDGGEGAFEHLPVMYPLRVDQLHRRARAPCAMLNNSSVISVPPSYSDFPTDSQPLILDKYIPFFPRFFGSNCMRAYARSNVFILFSKYSFEISKYSVNNNS